VSSSAREPENALDVLNRSAIIRLGQANSDTDGKLWLRGGHAVVALGGRGRLVDELGEIAHIDNGGLRRGRLLSLEAYTSKDALDVFLESADARLGTVVANEVVEGLIRDLNRSILQA